MHDSTLDNLIAAFLTGSWTENSLVQRAKVALGRSYRSIRPLARRILTTFPELTHPDRLKKFVLADDAFRKFWEAADAKPARLFFPTPVMAPHPFAKTWPVPAVTNAGQLCELLHIDGYQLDWLADVAGRNPREASPKLHHYRHRWLRKAGGRLRLLEIPKPMLKQIQNRILHLILDRIPPHPAAHGFRSGHSILTNANPHAGRAVVIGLDLVEFFPSILANQVNGIFRTAGYPPEVARILMGLCTTSLSVKAWDARPDPPVDGANFHQGQRLLSRHLPQGAPTSPALANLTAFHLDQRLQALADSLDVTYSRYADDLTFCGGPELARRSRNFCDAVGRIVQDEGFGLNPAKTRVMSQSVRQSVAGVVVNVRPTVPRVEIDRMKAILTNCLRNGPAAQNRQNHPDFRAYLRGKVAHVASLNPQRGRKLLALFDQIRWQAPAAAPTIAR